MHEHATHDARPKRIERASYDPAGTESLVVTVADAVARAKGIEAEDLGHRVFDAVDPDALERLFEPTSESTLEAKVTFRLDEFTVVVRNTGDVLVTRYD